MPKKKQAGRAAENSVPREPVKKQGARGKSARDPSVKHSEATGKGGAGGQKGGRSARGVGPECEKCGQIHKRCSAHNKRGGPCGQMPLRFQQVCRSHGGNTRQSKRAAQERMMELVWPAIARLDKLVNDPKTPDAIVVKVVAQILDRAHAAGLNKHARMDVVFEDSPWAQLEHTAFTIVRGRDAIVGDDDEHTAIDSGDLDEFDRYNLEGRRSALRGELDRASYLPGIDNSEIVVGRVVDPPGPIDYAARERARSRRPGEFSGGPDDGPRSGSRRYERPEE